jgi:hypothetical protein
MDTSALGAHAKRHLTEVARLQLIQDVLAAVALPAHQVRVGNQDGPGPLKAARAALEAVESLHTGLTLFAAGLLRGTHASQSSPPIWDSAALGP